MNHVDPELLAAWADDALSPNDARAVELHLADCSQCRAVAAAFSKTLEGPAVIVGGADRRIPIAARGTTAVPSHSRDGNTSLRAAASKWILPFAAVLVVGVGAAWKFWPQPPQPVAVAAVPAPVIVTAPPPAPTLDSIPLAATPRALAPSAPPAKAAKTQVAPAKRVAPKMTAPRPMPMAAPPPPPPAPAPVMPPPLAAAGPPVGATTIPVPTPPAQAPPVPAVQQLVVSDTMLRANSNGAQPVRAAGGGGGRGGGARAVLITSTAPNLWRIRPSNIVERSTDNGVTWSAVPIAAEGVQFTFGSAPTADVCWLIGRMGAVYVSSKGEAFKRLPFPEPANLTTVIAIDALKATVITADGRSFSTDDGGQIWRIARF